MARPLASPAPRAASLDLAAAVVVLGALLAGIAWPLAAVVASGLTALSSAPPLGAVLATLAVALAATVAALVAATAVAYTVVRVDVPGREQAWRVVRLGVRLPPFVVPLALLVLGVPGGLLAIAVGQALAFLPHATALLVRALAVVPVELEQAAEVLGAPRLTVLRRVTLGVAGPRVRAAALGVLGLCVADVAGPLLLGGDAVVLVTLVVAAVADAPPSVGSALGLGALGVAAALAGAGWGHAALAAPDGSSLPQLDRRAPALVRWWLGAAVWLVLLALATLWAVVPLGSLLGAGGVAAPSLEHWAALADAPGARALGSTLALGLGAALAGTALALAAAWGLASARPPLARAIEWLARVPVAVPGVVAGAGYLLAAGPPPPEVAGTLALLVPLVVCWHLPVTLQLARRGLAMSDPAMQEAALSLGAGRVTTLRRIVVPGLRPAAGAVLAASFAGGVLAAGTVVGVLGPGPGLGVTLMLALAASGAPGGACAVATVLLALAGGAVRLGRAIAGRERIPTLLA
jgi:iron(III) transport system permease protein